MKSITGTATTLMQSPAARRWIQILTIGIVVFFFALAVYSQLPQILSYNWVFDPAYFTLAFALLILRGPIVAYGWWTIMRLLGYPLPFLRTIRVVFHSSLARYLPGQMWYAVSRVIMTEKEGVPRAVTAVSLGIETAMVMVGAVLVSSLSLSVWHNAPLWLGGLIILGVVVIIARPQLLFGTVNWGLARIGRKAMEAKISSRGMLLLLWPFTLNWLVYGLMCFALTASLYPALQWTQAPAVGGLFSAAWLIGFLTIVVPQGFVIREGLIFTFLTTLIGVPPPVATAVAVLARLWSMVGEGIWAGISTKL